MVVGDRLWLFSQSPNSHPQPIPNNANVAMPLRGGFGGNVQALQPTASSSMLNEHSQCNIIAPEHSLNYGFSKPDTLYRHFLTAPMKPYESFVSNKYDKEPRNFSNIYLPSTQSKSLLSKLFPTNGFADKDSNDLNKESYYNGIRYPHHLLGRNVAESSIPTTNRDASMLTNEIGGIAELERAFGLNDKCNQLLNVDSKFCKRAIDDERNATQDKSDCCSENSDIDCEELDES